MMFVLFYKEYRMLGNILYLFYIVVYINIMSNRVFVNTEPISSRIAPAVRDEIMGKILEKYPDLGYEYIGSVGKKDPDDFNGDIDIAILCHDISELEYMVDDVFGYLDTKVIESYYIVSIKYPYKDNDIEKYVQCDFMIMWNPDYTKFRYKCPDYRVIPESHYKVGAKIMFSSMILNHCKERHEGLPEGCVGKFDFRPTALFRYVIDINNKRYKEEFVTYDPKVIAGYAFKDADTKWFDSVETLWYGIHSDKFKYPEETKALEINFFVNCYRKGWTSIKPEQFILQESTEEEIYKKIEEYKLINKINEFGQQGREI